MNQSRPELLRVIAELGEAFPEWRLGQLLCNLPTSAGKLDAGAVWDLEDDEALVAAQRLLHQHKIRALRPQSGGDDDEFYRLTATTRKPM